MKFRFLMLLRASRYTLYAYRRFLSWRFELVKRSARYTWWIFGRGNDNPTASCQITIVKNDEGTFVGKIDSLSGEDFYKCLPAGGVEELRKLGSIYEASVRESHLRLIRRALKNVATVEELGPDTAGHVSLVKVRITLRELPAQPDCNQLQIKS